MRDYTGKIKGVEREEKRERARHGMRLSGRSVKSVIAPTYGKRKGDPGQIHLLSWADGKTDAQHCLCGKVVYAYNLVTIYPSHVTCQECKNEL